MILNMSMQDSLERERNRVFPQDFSEGTMLAIQHHKNVMAALERVVQEQKKPVFLCPKCGGEIGYQFHFCCHCGTELVWQDV